MDEIHQYLTFRMEREEYALCVSNVKEILEVPLITRIPRMPDYMTGVINLRGSVVPIVDLKKKFGMESTAISHDTAIIVIEIPRSEDDERKIITVGIFADAVHKVVTIDQDNVEPPPKIGHAVDTDFIEGMGHIEDRFITILAITHILSVKELSREHEAETSIELQQ